MTTSNVTALGIAQDKDGNGLDAATHRKIIQSKWTGTGVVSGLDFKPVGGMRLRVNPGVAVLSRSEADGYVEAYWPGGEVTIDAPDAKDRYDVVWMRANDAAQGDSDNRVEVGVTKGTPADKPTVEDVGKIPDGSVYLGGVWVDANSSQLASDCWDRESTSYTVPSGTSSGTVGIASNTSNARKVRKGESWTFGSVTFQVPEGGRSYLAFAMVSVWATDCETYDWMGSGYVELLVDGTVNCCFKFACYPAVTTSQTFTLPIFLNEGTHTVSARLWGSGSDVVSSVVTQYESGYIPGQKLFVVDVGRIPD